nr:histone deacetylase 14 [Tanacetum cinerariifolium]
YLKFSAKGTKREVFGMPIPGSLITADIKEASYYQEYLANVAKHRRYLAGEIGSDPDSLAPKPTKPARKPKSTTPKEPPRPSVLAPVTSAQPEPTSAPAEPQGKKCKLTIEMSDKPSKAKKIQIWLYADMQKALEESLKIMYDVPRGLLPPVVIREPESGKYQPLPEVPGKGKAKSDSEEESEKVMPEADAGGQGEGQAGPDPGAQAKGQAGPEPGAQDEGLAGSNSDEQSKGQAGPDPGNAGADEQPVSSPVVHAGSDREHMDLDKVQENLKLTVKEQVLLEEPASSSRTLSSLQHLSKDISFGDLFFINKPLEADNDKANAKTKVESMVSVMIQQDMSSIPLMTSPIIDLTLRPESPKVHQQFKATATGTTITTTLPLPPYQQQSIVEAMMMKRTGELEHIMANLIQENKGLEERLDKHRERLYTLELLDIPHQVCKAVNEVVTDAPPPPPPPTGPSGASGALGASGSSQVPPPPPPPSPHQLRKSSHIPKVNLRQDWWKPLEEEQHATLEPAWLIPSSDTGDIATFMDWFYHRKYKEEDEMKIK